MKVVHVSNNDIGGAGIAAARLHMAMLTKGVDSWLLTKQKHDGAINNHVQFSPLKEFSNKFAFRLKLKKDKVKEHALYHLANRPSGYEHFSFPFSDYDIAHHPLIEKADIVHLHWVSDGFLDFSSFFEQIDKPVVWTLHDMNPFTGGCHHADGSQGYLKDCMSCPQLRGTVNDNYAAEMLQLKKSAIRNVPLGSLKIVGPSQWMLNCSKESALFSGMDHFKIHNLADTAHFFSRDKNKCRKELNLPIDKKILLFVAKDVDNPRKGIQYLMNVSRRFGNDVLLCGVGANTSSRKIPGAVNFNYVDDPALLNKIYNAADVFVLPSLAENFPNTVCESLLCGVPVVGFNVGGMSELINLSNGRLAALKDEAALKKCIEEVLLSLDAFPRSAISSSAKILLDPGRIVDEHLKIYRSFAT